MSFLLGSIVKIIFCCSCLVFFIIGILIGIFIGFIYHDDISEKLKIVLLKITQDKCKEYVKLACSFQTFSTPKPSSNQNGGKTNGKKVLQGMLPHQAYLEFPRTSNSEKSIICSGSLVSERFILTAAHCVDDANLLDGIVLLGTLDRSESNSTQRKRIKKAHIHSDYTTGKFAADLCLLELEGNVVFSSNVRPICLNTKLERNYDSIIVSGWGITEGGSNNSKHLNMADLNTHAYINEKTEASCRSYFDKEYETLHETSICFANLTEGINQDYDNGGPLQVKLQSKCQNTWEQIGITSMFAKNDQVGRALNLQLFVKVEYFFPWIANIVWPVASVEDESRTITVS